MRNITVPLLQIFCLSVVFLLLFIFSASPAKAVQIGSTPNYTPIEITFTGSQYSPSNMPPTNFDFWAEFRHESGSPIYKVYGFWDGNGNGGATGNVFNIRFTPTKTGRWDLINTSSNQSALDNQKEGDHIMSTASSNKGFWEVDGASNGGRWYKRSDGSHQYIFGNTHYTFLAASNGSTVTSDINGNANFFKKLRFSIHGDRFANEASDKPFFDDSGNLTDSGNFSHRPNPAWFKNRVDKAVQTALGVDLITDLILAGPDESSSRIAVTQPNANTFVKYIAARYGSYPNVWLTLGNEYTEFSDPVEMKALGTVTRSFLSYPVPLSVHATPGNWNTGLNGPWHDHTIIQQKRKTIPTAADPIAANYSIGGNKPVINDELAYEGAGDGWSEQDTIEAMTGAFLGGGYGTTGYKPVSKFGQYFEGNFSATEHKSADNIDWLRDQIDADITFWMLAPDTPSIFSGMDSNARMLEWAGTEYVIGTNISDSNITANLPTGSWTVKQYNVVGKTESTLTTSASGTYAFSVPSSRAVVTHFKRNGGGGQTPAPTPTSTPTTPPTQPPTTPATATPTSAPSVPGDANGDGNVDGLDYVTWLNNYNTNTTGGASKGDFDGSGTVDGLDYVIWLNNYGGSIAPTPTSVPSGVISNLSVSDTANSTDWSIQGNIQTGATQYGDRAFTLTSVPTSLAGSAWVRTANDSKSFSGDVATFKVNSNSTVYIAHNDLITTKPSWLSTYTDTGMNITNSEGTPRVFSLFSKTFASGATVTLGENGGNQSMYTVVVK